jgi:hypothetical protein
MDYRGNANLSMNKLSLSKNTYSLLENGQPMPSFKLEEKKLLNNGQHLKRPYGQYEDSKTAKIKSPQELKACIK